MQTLVNGNERATRILLVDDEPGVLLVLSEFLRRKGYEVTTASTGKEGWDLARQTRPDLIILDIALPDMDGIEVCRQIKADPRLTDTFVIVLSGAATGTAATVRGLETGADDYISKTVDPQEFLARVRSAIRLRDATAALREREQHYHGLVDILPDAVITTDSELIISSVNPRALTMLGRGSEQELLGVALNSLVCMEQRQRMLAEMELTVKTGVMRNAEYVMLRDGKEEFPVELSAAINRCPCGDKAGFVVVIRDITERKQAESMLRERMEFGRRIISTAMDGFWLLNTKGVILDTNDAYCEMSGYSKAELLTLSVADLDANETAEEVSVHIGSVIEKGEDRFETRHRRKDGRIIDVEVSTTFLDLRDGFLCVFLRDITENRRAQQRLTDALELNQSIMAASSVGILAFRRSGPCVFANDAAARMLRVSMNALPDLWAFSPFEEAGLALIARCVLENQKVQSGEVQYLHPCGKNTWFTCHMDCFVINGEPHLLVMLSDITQRKHAEDELKRLPGRILQAQEAERLRVSRDLHDGVNQTIASAKMRLHNVLERGSGALGVAHREILKRCERLLIQALEENRQIAHDLRPTDLDQLGFEAACRNFIQEFCSRSAVKVAFDIPEMEPRLPGSVEITLFRIMQEALNNVHKHAAAKLAEVQVSRIKDSVVLTVRDDGQGIKPQNGTVANRRRSHGLGLLGMKERIALLGGDLHIASTPGKGTTVSVTIACSDYK